MNLIQRILRRPSSDIDFEKVDENLEQAKTARDRLKERKNLDDPIIRRFYGYYPETRREAHEQS